MSILIFLEFELLLLPDLLNLVDVCFDLGFLLSAVYEFINLLGVFVKFELDQVIETEAWRVEVNRALSDSHQLLPVTFLHELGMQLRDQGKNRVHVLNSVVKRDESLPVLDVLVLRILGIGLLGLHILNELHKVFSINLVPKGGLPGLELEINEGNKIPHILELLELSFAVL